MKAIVTGHSRGLGAAIAADLLARKIPVLGLARSRTSALAQQFGSLFTETALDLSDSAAVLRWLASDALQDFLAGSKTVLLVNNAGMLQPVGPLETQEVAAIARTVSLNVATPLMLAAAVAASAAPDKRVLHISSGAGRSAYPGWNVYCATKAALDQHARAVALDASPALRICSLAPGVIDTDMQAEIRATPLEKFPPRERFEELKRSGGLTDAASAAKRLVDYLLSDKFGTEAATDLREV
jgi:NAD(P)-dependent dehydrogenase (short-subunit alcohol dehydrogenase family)